MDHPIPESLRRFATGASSRQENRVIVAHLLRGCAQCARLIREGQRLPVAEEAYDGVLAVIVNKALSLVVVASALPARLAAVPLATRATSPL